MRLALAAFAALVMLAPAYAQERHHPPQDMDLHEKFYSNWFQPDHPQASCCNKADCYPTQALFKDGFWWALQRETGKYVRIPSVKVEQNRSNPDGRTHVCMSPHGEVFCFSLGGGT